jgi:hypothetical protein
MSITIVLKYKSPEPEFLQHESGIIRLIDLYMHAVPRKLAAHIGEEVYILIA